MGRGEKRFFFIQINAQRLILRHSGGIYGSHSIANILVGEGGRGGGIHVVWGGDIPPLYVEGEYMYIYMPINI